MLAIVSVLGRMLILVVFFSIDLLLNMSKLSTVLLYKEKNPMNYQKGTCYVIVSFSFLRM